MNHKNGFFSADQYGQPDAQEISFIISTLSEGNLPPIPNIQSFLSCYPVVLP
jgi:hypothetical protein